MGNTSASCEAERWALIRLEEQENAIEQIGFQQRERNITVAKGVGAGSLVPSESILVQMTELEDFCMENITNDKMGIFLSNRTA